MSSVNNVVSFSGGKDSTAMLHMMLERGEDIHSVLCFDTGWEFPEMYEHIDLVEQKTGIEIIRIKPEKTFDHWMLDREVIAAKGVNKGVVHRIGYGWPNIHRRWCTKIKTDALDKFKRKVKNPVECIGVASDEMDRVKPGKRYPLIEYAVTEAQALSYCRSLGYTWGGLYGHFGRVSCWCCPLSSLPDLRVLRSEYPELWKQLNLKDLKQRRGNTGFRGDLSVADLDNRFALEELELDPLLT